MAKTAGMLVAYRVGRSGRQYALFPVVQLGQRLVAGATVKRFPTMAAADQECGRRNIALATSSPRQQRGGTERA
jgi:hypothetical protein